MPSNFNTSRVRLEGTLAALTCTVAPHFNTSRVRLEGFLNAIGIGRNLVFQYLKGAIRGRYEGIRVFLKHRGISIPQGCD